MDMCMARMGTITTRMDQPLRRHAGEGGKVQVGPVRALLE